MITYYSGYVESHEDLLTEAMYTMCNAYNKANHQKIDPVFFHEAVHHAARISRVMVSAYRDLYNLLHSNSPNEG